MTEKNQIYRANVAGIIFDKKGNFLLTQLFKARVESDYDFVKGGMIEGESELETLEREIVEELGGQISFRVIKKSEVAIIYEWPKHLQEESGYRGQARVSYWVMYESGNIHLEQDKFRGYKWMNKDEFEKSLLASRFPKIIVNMFLREWEEMGY